MVDTLRLAGMVLLLMAVALAAALLQPEWAHDLHLEQWTLTALEREWFGDSSEQAKRDEITRILQLRLSIKSDAIKELIEGRRPLPEVVTIFRHLNNENDKLGLYKIAEPPEEEARQQVILWAHMYLRRTYPESAEEMIARLEEELRRLEAPNDPASRPAYAAH